MKINFDSNIKGLDGKDLATETGTATLSSIVTGALIANYHDEQFLPGMEKFKRAQLAQRVYAGGDIDFSVEELTLIKELVGKYATPLVVLQIFKLIDKKDEAPTAA